MFLDHLSQVQLQAAQFPFRILFMACHAICNTLLIFILFVLICEMHRTKQKPNYRLSLIVYRKISHYLLHNSLE